MKITAVGGYEEVGRNMTLLEFGNDSIIVDMGIRLDRVMIHEDTDVSKLTKAEMVDRGIIPDDSIVKGKVKAIVLSHGHLDHIGAVTILMNKYPGVPIIGTPLTLELIRREFRKKKPKNMIPLNLGETFKISPDVYVEFVGITHSIPQTAMVVFHTPEGKLVYMNDFRLDNHPVIGEKPDYQRIKELGDEGIQAYIIETTRIEMEGRTPSESIARELVRDILEKTDPEKGIIITTFSSHISRIKSITEMAEELGRTPVLLGRSMEKYTSIAEYLGILQLPEDSHAYGSPDAIRKSLNTIDRDGREKYMMLVTGHQGEPDALLSRIANKKFNYRVKPRDQIIFSADVIPNPINVANRYAMETKLKLQGARIIKGAHVSGHAYREDHRDLLHMLKPRHIIPCHGNLKMLASYAELAENEGYSLGKNIHLIRNGKSVTV